MSDPVYSLIAEIESCRNESYVAMVLAEIFDLLDISSWVFVSLLQDAKTRDSYRYLIGCDHNWCHVYNLKKWHATDPFISYSRKFGKPLVGSELSALSDGQKEMVEHSAKHGFRSSIVIPAHSGSNKRIGMLYVGNTLEPEVGEKILHDQRFVLREISHELLDWWITKLQSKVLDGIKLSKEEIHLLRLAYQEYTAREMSEMTGLTESQVNNRFRNINATLQVDNKKDAAFLAMEYGLITPY